MGTDPDCLSCKGRGWIEVGINKVDIDCPTCTEVRVLPDDHVICPACAHHFHAVSQHVKEIFVMKDAEIKRLHRERDEALDQVRLARAGLL